jgi:hypothetical protein
MPAPNTVAAILDPSMRPGRPSLATLLPATPERVAALDAFGGDRAAAIAKLADVSPAKQLWSDLVRLNAGDLAAAHALGAADAALVDGIRSHLGLPAGVPAGAGLTLALAGNEAFSSHRSLPLSGAQAVTLANHDGAAHQISMAAFTAAVGGDRFDWGRFSWQTIGAPVTVPAHTTMAVTLPLPAATFALWLGDIDSGDQASVVVMNGPVVITPPAPVPPGPATVVPTPTPAPPQVTNSGPGSAPAAAPAPKPAAKPKAVKAKVVKKTAVRRTVAARSSRRVVRSVRRLASRFTRVVRPAATRPAPAPAPSGSPAPVQSQTVRPPVQRF